MEYKFKRLIRKPCGWCGKEFETGRDNEFYCSEECKREKRKENSRNYHARQMKLLREQEAEKEKRGMSELAVKNAKARALDMSYGQYDVAVRFGRVANG